MAGENPVLIAPDGGRHTLELQNLVPVMPVVKDQKPAEMLAPSGTAAADQGGKQPDKPAEGIPKEHYLTHFPKLSTCDVCQRAKAQRATCKRKKQEQAGMPAGGGLWQSMAEGSRR